MVGKRLVAAATIFHPRVNMPHTAAHALQATFSGQRTARPPSPASSQTYPRLPPGTQPPSTSPHPAAPRPVFFKKDHSLLSAGTMSARIYSLQKILHDKLCKLCNRGLECVSSRVRGEVPHQSPPPRLILPGPLKISPLCISQSFLYITESIHVRPVAPHNMASK